MHAVISLLLQSTKFWRYLTVFFDAASRRHSMYLFTVPVNLIYVKLWGLATKIRF